MNIPQTDSDICCIPDDDKKFKAGAVRIEGSASQLDSLESNISGCSSFGECKSSKPDLADDVDEGDEEQLVSSDEPAVACHGSWEKMYGRLVDFLEKYGHCRVPYRFKDDPQLGAWVATQRRSYKLMQTGRRKKTSLTPERQNELAKIGFEWSGHNPHNVPWEKRFVHLLEFVSLNGHAQVPTKWEENCQLSNWVSRQRREYQKLQSGQPSVLTKDRIKLLNCIDFVWEAQRGGVKRINQNGSVAQAPCGKIDAMASSADSLRLRAQFMLRFLRDNNTAKASDIATILLRGLMASDSSAKVSNTTMINKCDVAASPMLGNTHSALPMIGKKNPIDESTRKREEIMGFMNKALQSKWGPGGGTSPRAAAALANNLVTKRHPADNLAMLRQQLAGRSLPSPAATLDPSFEALSKVATQSGLLPPASAQMRIPTADSLNPSTAFSERLARLKMAKEALHSRRFDSLYQSSQSARPSADVLAYLNLLRVSKEKDIMEKILDQKRRGA